MNKKVQNTTMYKNNRQVGSKIRDCSLLLILSNLIANCQEIVKKLSVFRIYNLGIYWGSTYS